MEIVLMIGASAVALAVALAWWTHNRLMALDERCATAFADVDPAETSPQSHPGSRRDRARLRRP